MKEQGKKVVLYCRTARRNKSAIKKQRLEMERYCVQQGLTIAAVYEDNGFSGMTNDRPGLKKMLRNAAKGKFSVVVVGDVSRLSRSTSGSLDILYAFRSHGVVFCVANQTMGCPRTHEVGMPSLMWNRPVRHRVPS